MEAIPCFLPQIISAHIPEVKVYYKRSGELAHNCQVAASFYW